VIRILGIDPGSRKTGIGIIDIDPHGKARLVHAEVLNLIRTTDDFCHRLGQLCDGIDAIISHWQPQQCAIETVFVDKSAQSALKLGHARGAAIATVVRRQISIAEYAPRLIKQSLVGKGSAEKSQVQHMVKLILNIQNNKISADAADALAVALTHANMAATATQAGVSIADIRRRRR